METWEVYWFTRDGEECIETFESKEMAQNFITYNEWGKNEHPKLRKSVE